MTDWKALCKELVQQLDDALDFTVSSDTRQHMKSIAALARTALAQPEPAGPTAAIEQAWKRHSKIPTFNDEEVLSPEGFRAAVAEIFGAAQPQPAEWRLVVDSDGKPIGRLTASGELEPWDQ